MALSLTPIAPNQTLLTLPNAQILFSYSTPVAACVDGTFYRTSKKFSTTTSKHINKWLRDRGCDKAEQRDPSFFQELAGN